MEVSRTTVAYSTLGSVVHGFLLVIDGLVIIYRGRELRDKEVMLLRRDISGRAQKFKLSLRI